MVALFRWFASQTTVTDSTTMRRVLRTVVLFPLALTLTIVLIFVWQIVQLIAVFEEIVHSDEVMAQIPVLQSRWLDMEVTLGRYMTTGDPADLVSYEQIRDEVDTGFGDLGAGLVDHPDSFALVVMMQELQAAHRGFAVIDLAARAEPGPPAELSGGPVLGPQVSPRVRLAPRMAWLMADLALAEQAGRSDHTGEAKSTTWRAVGLALGATVLMSVGLAGFGHQQLVRVARDYQNALDLSHAQADELRRLASHDVLTGLPNRSLFYERLVQALHTDGAAGGSAAVFFVDLDGFKEINDRLGHAAGDDLLKSLARRLTMSVRPGDLVARLGGDEFTVLAVPVADVDEAEAIARAIRASLATPFVLDGQAVTITASIGIALADSTSSDADALLRRSDAALYQAKADGKARFVVAAGD